MEREILWAPHEAPGLEHLRLREAEGAVRADGLIIGAEEGELFRLHYTLRCDTRWRTREVQITVTAGTSRDLCLRASGNGRWTDGTGNVLSALDGCLDIDITATPFTNTLPIRRLGLCLGESAELSVVYITAPSLKVTVERQRYTSLETSGLGSRYRFEAPADDFTAEITVDGDGLVMEYPGLFRRVRLA